MRAGEGYSDQFISTRFDISGVFENPDDRFDPSRHTLTVTVKVKEAVTAAVANVALRMVDARTTLLFINQKKGGAVFSYLFNNK